MRKSLLYLVFFLLVIVGCVFYTYKTHPQQRSPFVCIPLHKLEYSDYYYLNIEIENHVIPVILDTGFSTPFALHKDFLDAIQNKRDEGQLLTTIDINGNTYKKKSYLIESIEIEKQLNVKATVEQDDPFFHTYGSSFSSSIASKEINPKVQEILDKKIGTMGFRVLKDLPYWCIDFPGSKMYAIRDLESGLKKLNLSSKNLLEIPILDHKDGIEIVIDTDFGIKHFILDTASSNTLINCPSEKSAEHTTALSNKFIANNHHLGKQEIFFFNLPQEFKCDGLLGMDFLKDKTILFDFKNNKMFIKIK